MSLFSTQRDKPSNESFQPTPGLRLVVFRSLSARRGCTQRSTNMRLAFSIVLAGLLFCGCQSTSKLDSGDFHDFLQRASHSHKQSGNFGAFFVQQVRRYGGYAAGVGSPPELRGRWYWESDLDGFAVQLYDVSFPQVRSFMEAVYGAPLDLSTNAGNPPSGLYGVKQIGVGIQYFANTNGVGFICVQKRKQ